MSKKFSIILPCYNVESYIDKCLDTLIRQTIGLENLELICINDASTDSTLSLLMSYEQQYPDSIIIINLPTNQRQGGARNIGLQYASGEYISFFDSDDWADLRLYEKVYEKAKQYDCDIVHFECFDFVKDDTFIPSSISTGSNSRLITIENETQRKFFLENVINERFLECSCRNKIYKKNFLLDTNVSFPSHCVLEEPLFVYPLYFYTKRFYVLEERLYYYRYNPFGTMQHTLNQTNKWLDHIKVHLLLFEELEKRGLITQFHDEIELYYLWNLYIETIGFIFRHTNHFPMDLYEYIRESTLTCFPNFSFNTYINRPEYDLLKKSLHSLYVKLNQEQLNALKPTWITL
ncbi:glycosyltransferase involved in cell wall biosynthesis [Lachnotalea glycerini]|uniref:Glycosyltransferase involved in cell wall biosynthesis n=1 Tax=Lachnotalea glycerini TaxID=1763509 RepID=A0A318ES43_9FIRM|nr:glycosyltransferase family 2 protein [Lachnotalea glycerini]PXV90132.1 glycosyltransferase involved in cell wall biosynthesis [Lachnotalea glycerini]